jgi:hypothetical protein
MDKCKCRCEISSKELPLIIGGILVYELATIIVLLFLILIDMDGPCDEPCCDKACSLDVESDEIAPEE